MRTFSILLSLLFITAGNPVLAQAEMADTMRAEGKIYVVVAIILLVLAGMFVYLFLIDRKIKKLENILRDRSHQTK
jgi:hypothetical protein